MRRVPVQSLAAVAAVALLVAGLLGFVPGITTHYGHMRFAGRGSHAELFGFLRTSILLDLFHVALGVAGLVLARTVAGARAFLLGSGIANLVVWLVGVAGAGGWVPLNVADNWAHFAAGVVLVALSAVSA